jgi:hypothetical protein
MSRSPHFIPREDGEGQLRAFSVACRCKSVYGQGMAWATGGGILLVISYASITRVADLVADVHEDSDLGA